MILLIISLFNLSSNDQDQLKFITQRSKIDTQLKDTINFINSIQTIIFDDFQPFGERDWG